MMPLDKKLRDHQLLQFILNFCAKCRGNPFNSIQDILLKTTTLMWMTKINRLYANFHGNPSNSY